MIAKEIPNHEVRSFKRFRKINEIGRTSGNALGSCYYDMGTFCLSPSSSRDTLEKKQEVKSEIARQTQIKSATGIYHVMLKGLGGRNIFLDDADRSIILEKLNKAREIGGFELYSYCFMDNHVIC